MDEGGEDGRDGLGRVAEGLRLLAFGLAASAVSTVASLAVLVAVAEPGKDLPAILMDLNRDRPEVMVALLALNVLAIVLGIAGKAFCLSVPPAAGATPFIVMTLACDVIGLLTMIVGRVGDAAGSELVPIMAMATLFGYFAFLRFLRRLSEYFRSPALVARARRIQVGSASLIVATFLAALVLNSGGGQAMVSAVGLLILVALPYLFVLLARTVIELRREARAAAEAFGDGY
jgi:hypothetical protein